MSLGRRNSLVTLPQDVLPGRSYAVLDVVLVLDPIPVHFIDLPLPSREQAPRLHRSVVVEVPLPVGVVLEDLVPFVDAPLDALQHRLVPQTDEEDVDDHRRQPLVHEEGQVVQETRLLHGTAGVPEDAVEGDLLVDGLAAHRHHLLEGDLVLGGAGDVVHPTYSPAQFLF
jgi:hypothetical protein